jgi:methyl coenzyme M reductase subunit D
VYVMGRKLPRLSQAWVGSGHYRNQKSRRFVDLKGTPYAAELTAGNLVVEAAKARGQMRQKHFPKRR